MLLAASTAAAGDVQGRVVLRSLDGGTERLTQPVVVYLTGFKQPPPPESPVIAQKDKTFVPDLRVVVAGQTVQFTNDDPVVHNVFSTSAARNFDLGQPGPQQTRSITFTTPGLVDVFCNIHEAMFAHVLVLPNRAFALVEPDGRFTIKDVPPGRHPLHAWGRTIEPYEQEVVVTADQPAVLELQLRPRLFNPAHVDKFGRSYRKRPGYSP